MLPEVSKARIVDAAGRNPHGKLVPRNRVNAMGLPPISSVESSQGLRIWLDGSPGSEQKGHCLRAPRVLAPAYRVHGRMAEWFKAAVLKTAVGESPPWVRIPLLPPGQNRTGHATGRRFYARGGGKRRGKFPSSYPWSSQRAHDAAARAG